jgi:hypothetical protein
LAKAGMSVIFNLFVTEEVLGFFQVYFSFLSVIIAFAFYFGGMIFDKNYRQ